MANPIPKPILGAFEDIGENITSSLKQIPKDVGQAAMESIGLGNATKSSNTGQTKTAASLPAEGSKWQEIDNLKDTNLKKQIARAALAEIGGNNARPKEQSIWEKIMKEEEQKKMAEQQKKPASVQLPSSGARKVPGMKSAAKNKSPQQESSKNTRQD